MEHRHSRKRSIAGFTMAEVLVTVGIVAILLAVAVPGVIAARANLKMTELDATAREIFLAAQNSLTGHKAAGTLEQVGTLSGGDPRFLRDGEDGMDALLPMGAIDPTVAGNHYIVRLNLEYATVLDVFYSEEEFGGTAEELYGAMNPAAEGAAAARREAKVGYYGGGGTEYNRLEQLLSPTMEIINDDELRVNVTVPDYVQYQEKGVKLTVWVETLAGSSKQEFELKFEGGDASLLLDSLEPGKQFSSLCSGITPGAQIRVTATLSAANCLPSSVSAETNSLFAGRQGDTVFIAYARHLQNLMLKYLDKNYYYTGLDNSIKNAMQIQDIIWPNKHAFLSLENTNLRSYDGNGLEIRNLKTAVGGNSGLFKALFYTDLSNIRLVNPVIFSTGGSVGGLAGTAEESTITNCWVYSESLDENGNVDYTNLTGSITTSDSGATVGGLIGTANSCSIVNCAVGLPEVSANGVQYLGGLIGTAEKCTITNSYASVDQLGGTAEYSGMFIGRSENSGINGCYAVGNLSAISDNIYGFMGGNGTAKNSYCAVTYLLEDGSSREGKFRIVNGFMYGDKIAANCAYLNVGITASNEDPDGVSPLSYDELTEWKGGDSWSGLSAVQSHPYHKELDGKAYPFPGLANMEHYGSWPDRSGKLYLAYYEITSDKPFTIYLTDADSDFIYSNDLTNSGVVTQDGYALLSTEQLSSLKVTYSTSAAETAEAVCTLSDYIWTFGTSPQAYYVYLLPTEALQTPYASTEFYQQLSCGGQTFWYNPHFAKAAVNSDKIPETTPAEISVRSARQLAALGEHPEYWNQHFTQELDIDYYEYDYPGMTFVQKCIGTNVAPFRGEYNGGSHKILEVAVPYETYYGGLFGVNEGRITALSVSPASVLYGNVPLFDAGILAGYNSTGRIDGCSVFIDKALSFNITGYWGGLVGINAGMITDSLVAGEGSVSGSTHAASFAGWNIGNITRCYSNLRIEGSSSASGFVVLNNSDSTQGIIQDCYALSAVQSAGVAAGFSAMGGGSFAHCYAAATVEGGTYRYGFAPHKLNDDMLDECYYLSGDYPQEWQGGTSASYDELIKLSPGGGWSGKTAAQSHPYSDALQGQAYPLPGLTGLDHWGDWPEKPAQNTVAGLVYYEKYSDGSYGFYGLDEQGSPADSLKGNTFTIQEAGYGFLLPEDTELSSVGVLYLNNTPYSGTVFHSGRALNGSALYPFSDGAITAISKVTYSNYSKIEFYVNGQHGKLLSTHYLNVRYAAAIVSGSQVNSLGTTDLPLQIRTQVQLSNLQESINVTCYFLQTHNIALSSTWASITLNNNSASTFDGNGDICEISGSTAPLFQHIPPGFHVQNLRIMDAKIDTSENAGVLAVNNAGIITNCIVTGSIHSTRSAAGFVYMNQGTIRSCYSNCTVSGNQASGFVWSNTGGGNITDCYALLEVTGSTTAAGFVLNPGYNSVKNCYTAATVSGQTAYGFGPAAGSVNNCYYFRQPGLKADIGMALDYNDMIRGNMQLTDTSVWIEPRADRSHPNSAALQGETYPFPMLAELPHYGDWPLSSAPLPAE